jgi:hypothetical protein
MPAEERSHASIKRRGDSRWRQADHPQQDGATSDAAAETQRATRAASCHWDYSLHWSTRMRDQDDNQG